MCGARNNLREWILKAVDLNARAAASIPIPQQEQQSPEWCGGLLEETESSLRQRLLDLADSAAADLWQVRLGSCHL